MSNYKPDLGRKEIDGCFERLQVVLRIRSLPTEFEGPRLGVCADEFMFMNYTYAGHVRFKHIVTRNYLILNPDDTLTIPTGAPFFLGFFDSALGEA